MSHVATGTAFWKEARRGLFLRNDNWQQVVDILPEQIHAVEVTSLLQSTHQLLNSNMEGAALIAGNKVLAHPDTQVLGENLPPEGELSLEVLFLQWMFQYYILEGISEAHRTKPLTEWSATMLYLVEQVLQFTVYSSALILMYEEGTLSGNLTKSDFAAQEPQVKARIADLSKTLCSKAADYGESFRRHGLTGLIPRIWDKAARYAQLSSVERAANYEPKLDSARDLFGYCLIAWSLLWEIDGAQGENHGEVQ